MSDDLAGGFVVDPPVGGGIPTDPPLGGGFADPAVGGGLAAGQGLAGPPGASAYDLAGGDAAWGSLAAWLASLGGASARPPAPYPIDGAASFTLAHGLAYPPHVRVVDPAGAELDTDTIHAPGQVTVVFAAPFTGTLYLG